MGRYPGIAAVAATTVGLLAGLPGAAAFADDGGKATADAGAQALVGAGTPLLAALSGVDVYGSLQALTPATAGLSTRLGIACAEPSCTVTVSASIRVFDAKSHLHTQTLKGSTVTLTAGGSRLVTIKLSTAQQALVRTSRSATMKLGIGAATSRPVPAPPAA